MWWIGGVVMREGFSKIQGYRRGGVIEAVLEEIFVGSEINTVSL